jgi:hypothetical protein
MIPAIRHQAIFNSIIFNLQFLIPGSLITGVDAAFTEFCAGELYADLGGMAGLLFSYFYLVFSFDSKSSSDFQLMIYGPLLFNIDFPFGTTCFVWEWDQSSAILPCLLFRGIRRL